MDDIGFPQLNPASYPSQIFWLGVAFVLMYGLMSKVALPRVTDVLERRRRQKGGDLESAAQASEEAEKIKTAYEKSLAKAQQDAAAVLASSHQSMNEKISAEQSRFAENSRKRLLTTEQNILKAKTDALHSLVEHRRDPGAQRDG